MENFFQNLCRFHRWPCRGCGAKAFMKCWWQDCSVLMNELLVVELSQGLWRIKQKSVGVWFIKWKTVSKKIDEGWCKSWWANEAKDGNLPYEIMSKWSQLVVEHSSVEKCCCQGDSAGGYLAVQTFLEQTHPKICGAVGICPAPLGPDPTSKFEFCWDASPFLDFHTVDELYVHFET